MLKKPSYEELEKRVQELEQVHAGQKEIRSKTGTNTLPGSEDRFRSLIEEAPMGISLMLPDRRFIFFNRHFTNILGYTLDDIPDKDTWFARAYPDSDYRCHVMGTWRSDLGKDMTSGRIKPAEFKVRCKDDCDRVIRYHSIPLKDGSQVLIYEDITEQKQAEEKLHLAHEKLLTILDSIDATIYVADMDTCEILFMNKKMIETFDRDMTGEICFKAFRKELEPCAFCTNDQLVDKDGNPTGVCVWQGRNPITGKAYINHDRAIEWIDGRMARLQIAVDITDQIKIEEQLRQAQKMEAIGTLAGGIAHDFNNMLTVILGYAQSGLRQVDPSHGLHHKFQQILNAAIRSADITRQLLAFARKQTIDPKILDLNLTMAGMLKILRRLLGEDIDISWKPGANLWPVKMDPSQIDQILANLCVNARDAISGVGHLTIETGTVSFNKAYCAGHAGIIPGDFVLLAVSDDGCGMGKEILENLFEPFFTTKEVGKGTGLGLSTVYGIVKQNNGFINVYSEPGQGTTFRIYLPRYRAKDEAPTQSPSQEMSARGIETVLLVEDEEMILDMTTETLESLGYTVLAADRPGKAIRMAGEHAGEIHLLITDVVLPEMNGRDLARHLTGLYPDLKLLFMSGYTANVIAHNGILDK